MVLVTLEAVVKSHGTTTLLDGVSLGLDEKARIGIVGRNGAGKSTLLDVLTGAEPPDSGRVVRTGGLRLGRLSQNDDLPPGATAGEVIVAGRAEHVVEGDPVVRSILDGLQVRPRFDAAVATLSGGERRRVALASLLVTDAVEGLDLLVLDEPTNHLDVEGVDWLARHLATRPQLGLAVVTHDRWFLDAVCDTTWEVEGGKVHAYEGGYAAYVLARAERSRQTAASEARRQNLLRKELAWLRRGAPARTSKPQFRIAAAEALIADEPAPRDQMQLRTFAARRLGKTVYDLEDVTLTAGDRTLLRDVTWRLGPGDRVALVGVNGSGKTSLLKMLVGERRPDAGNVKVGQTVEPGYLSQHVTELPASQRVLEAVEQVGRVLDAGAGRTLTAGQLLEAFGFVSSRQWTRVGDLSGGERRRLQLLRLLMARPNVLLLDEPTNDLDVDTLTALEDLLDTWPGTLIVVSHDRYLVERVCDTVVALMGDGQLAALPGGVGEYLQRRRDDVATGAAAAGGAPPAPSRGAGSGASQSRAAGKELARLERQVSKLDGQERKLHADLAAAGGDWERTRDLDEQLRAVRKQREEVEEAWFSLAEDTD